MELWVAEGVDASSDVMRAASARLSDPRSLPHPKMLASRPCIAFRILLLKMIDECISHRNSGTHTKLTEPLLMAAKSFPIE